MEETTTVREPTVLGNTLTILGVGEITVERAAWYVGLGRWWHLI
jgi:hypothetical protein